MKNKTFLKLERRWKRRIDFFKKNDWHEFSWLQKGEIQRCLRELKTEVNK